ncbi:MAG: STAS domain-containing protein [Acidobacteriaceae bacterium]
MMLNAKVEQIAQKKVVITVSGSMTLGSSLKVLDAQLQNLVSNGVNTIVFDLTDVDFIDSAGLGLLMLAHGLLEKENTMLRLCGAQARVRALLKMTKTDSLLHLDESREESLEAILHS